MDFSSDSAEAAASLRARLEALKRDVAAFERAVAEQRPVLDVLVHIHAARERLADLAAAVTGDGLTEQLEALTRCHAGDRRMNDAVLALWPYLVR